jgi:glutathione S-transferase
MTLRLHDISISGHAYRVRLFLSLLDLPHTLIPVDAAKGAHKAPAFLALNPFGQVPVLEDGDVVIADSNAILVYLAERYGSEAWRGNSPESRAKIQRWFSVAAGQLAFQPAAARRANLFKQPLDPELIKQSHALLSVIDKTLSQHSFITGTVITIADLALYSYIVVAPEGNVSLEAYPNIRGWLARIEALPKFVAMPRSKVGLSA